MTRTGLSPRLLRHTEGPAAAIAPADAARLRLQPGDLLRLESPRGATLLPASIEPGQRPGEVFVPMHWTDAFASAGPIDRLVTPACDPVSGQPELKATPTRAPVLWRGLLLHRRAARPAAPGLAWSRLPLASGHALELAGTEPLPEAVELGAYARAIAGAAPEAEWLEMLDARRGSFRFAAIVEGRVEACLFLATGAAALPARAALAGLLDSTVGEAARTGLLAGRAAPAGPADRTICVCFSVGVATLRRAILDQSLGSVEQIGAALRAGTNCGSCVPELKEFLRDARTPVPA
jgi:assimilatory nitrate reductase catalytic subunit